MSEEKVRTTLYFRRSVKETFSKICQREGEKVSHKIEAYMTQYNQAHTPGNPQLTIVSYADSDEPQPMRVLCLFIDGALSDGKIHCRRSGSWIPGVQCYSCDKNQLRRQV